MGTLLVFGACLVSIPFLTKLDHECAKGKERSHDPILIFGGLFLIVVGVLVRFV